MSFPAGPQGPRDFDPGPVRRRIGPVVFLLALALGALPAAAAAEAAKISALAQLPEHPDWLVPIGTLQVRRDLSLDPITPAELLGGGAQAVSMGRWSPGAGPLLPKHVSTRIERTIPSVWRMRVADLRAADALDVRCDVRSLHGVADALSAIDGSTSEIPIRVEPLPPVVVVQDENGAIVEGGVRIVLDVGDVRSAGRYTASLTVTIQRY